MRLIDYFIASSNNDYQPWIISTKAFAVFCLLVWSARLFIPADTVVVAAGISANELMEKINNERVQRYLPSLIAIDKLSNAATIKTEDMLKRSYFAHVNPDGQYVWPTIEAQGYTPYLTLGENLAMDFYSADSVVTAWMNSPTHRANLLNEKFQDQGMASVYGTFEPGRDTIMIANLFGTLLKKPVPAPASQSQENPTETPKITTPPKIATTPTTPKPDNKPAPSQQPEQSSPVVKETQTSPVQINPDIKITKRTLETQIILEIDLVVSGNPSKVKAIIKDKEIELLPSAIAGQFLGVATFAKDTDLSDQTLTIKAIDKNNQETVLQTNLSNLKEPVRESFSPLTQIPGSGEAQFLRLVKIILAVLAIIYISFLVIDSIIIHRAKIKRANINSSPHILLFLLIAIVNIFATWL